MNKLFSKIVSALTAATMTLFASSGSMQTFVNEIEAHAAETDVILGDVDGDEKVNVFDLCLMKRELLNPDSTSIDLTATDVNADGAFDVKDVVEVQEFLLCKRDHFSASHKTAAENIKNIVNTIDYAIATPNEPIETSLTVEMANYINSMDSLVDIYRFLYNNVSTEFYFGSRKGSIGTFEQHGGNDIDQASLLIAILRYLGYDADYITALVELSPQQAMEITATTDIDTAFRVLKAQANDDVKTSTATYDENGEISSVIIEHTWVKATIPSCYVNDDGSDNLLEVQLDTSFKPLYRVNLYEGIVEIIGDENADMLTDSAMKNSKAGIKSITDALIQQNENKAVDEIIQIKDEIIFSCIPTATNIIVSNTVEGVEYLDGRRDQILFSIGGSNVAVLSSAEAYGKRLVIEYDFDSNYELFSELLMDMPKTIFDITASHTKSGIGVQAYIKLDGKVIGTGASVPIGTEQAMTITLYTGGTVNELSTTNMLSGSMYAITLDTQNIACDDLYKSIQEMSLDFTQKSFRETYTDEFLGTYLSSIGKLYMTESDSAKTLYADMYNILPERHLSVCVTSFNLDMEKNLIGQLEINERGSIGLDVKSDSFTSVSLMNSQDDIDLFYQNVGVRGSYLEGEVLESITGVESVSTMKILDTAKKNNVEIFTISKSDSNYTLMLDSLKYNDIPSIAYDEIAAKVEAGYKVIVPSKNIQINSWSGVGYIIIGKNGYSFMLSNSTNGGETTDLIDEWASRGDDVFVALYWFAFITATIACITAAVALFPALLPAISVSVGKLIMLSASFLWAFKGMVDSGFDLLSYYNGLETSADKFKTSGSIVTSAFIEYIILKYGLGG